MAYRPYCVVSGVFFEPVALTQLLRIVNEVPVLVDEYDVPMLDSSIGFAVPAGLAFRAFRLK